MMSFQAPQTNQNSEITSSLQLTQQKLNESNFRGWFQSMLLIIKGEKEDRVSHW